MSSADVRDVLGTTSSDLPRHVSKKIKADAAGRRLDGMQRELYSLLGENTPTVAVSENRFKVKPGWKRKAVPWVWKPFTNKARTDGLVLHHWVRGDEANNTEQDSDDYYYPFAKYNQKIRVPKITKNDYDEALKSDDWTFDETKYLFDLCEEYDLRWMVIHDRYDYKLPKKEEQEQEDNDSMDVDSETDAAAQSNEAKQRGIEDLQERYYTCYVAIYRLREQHGDKLSPAEEDLLKQMKFSKESELKRKAHLQRLLSRPPAEIAEEEALVIESRKLEAAAERMLIERNEILRLLDAPQPTSSVSQFQSSQGLAQLTTSLLTSDKVRKKRDVSAGDSPAVASQTGSASSSQNHNNSNSHNHGNSNSKSNNNSSNSQGNNHNNSHNQNQQGQGSSASQNSGQSTKTSKKPAILTGAAAVQHLIQKKLTAKEEAAFGLSYHDKLTPGVYIRTSKITTYKSALQVKMAATLKELGIPTRPIMPTAKVCAKMESLLQSVTVLLEAKRQLDKLETELKIKEAL